ncbi:MAG: hypothetical protein ACOYT8_05445 [Candidatus Dependentiae bacterium]
MIVLLLGISLTVCFTAFSMEQEVSTSIELMTIISRQSKQIISMPELQELPAIVCVQHEGNDHGEIHWFEGKKLQQNGYAIARTKTSKLINIVAYKKTVFNVDPNSILFNDAENSITLTLKDLSRKNNFVVKSTMKQFQKDIINSISINGIEHIFHSPYEIIPMVKKIIPISY